MKADYNWVRVTLNSAGDMLECFDWLAGQNFQHLDHDPGLTPKFGSEIIWDFGFQDINHALLFKLRWGGK